MHNTHITYAYVIRALQFFVSYINALLQASRCVGVVCWAFLSHTRVMAALLEWMLPVTGSSWERLRKKLVAKRDAWANSKCYYHNHPTWGSVSSYGFDLKATYAEKDFAAAGVETMKDEHPELFSYLTTVSREIFVASYPHVFSLGEYASTMKDTSQECTIPVGETMSVDVHWEEYMISDTGDDCPYWDDGMVRVGEGGCQDWEGLVLKGNHRGSVWSCYSNDDGYASLRAASFEDYVHSTQASSIVVAC